MELEDIAARGHALSTRAYLATCGADGAPDVVPVHPGWEGTTLWIMTGRASVKVRNIGHNPSVALHWEVTSAGDGLLLWGTAAVHGDRETKRRLWTGTFDYDLDQFAPGGVDSPDVVFVSVKPERAVAASAYGSAGVERWRAS